MKKIIILLPLLALCSLMGFTQDNDLQKLFNRYADKPGFELEVENPEINIDVDGDADILKFLDKVEHLFILSFDGEMGNQNDRTAFETRLEKLISKKRFKSMVDISGESGVKILTRKNSRDKATDYLLMMHGDEDAMFLWASGE